jgi:Uma2 family endonuclease
MIDAKRAVPEGSRAARRTREMATTVAAPIAQEDEPKRLTTADEFLLMPKGVNKQELIRGEVVEMSPVSGPHAVGQATFTTAILPHVRRHQLGKVVVELGFRFSRNPDTVRAPDVAFISAEQLALKPLGRGFYDGYPDIAVEVISPGDTAGEVEDKVREYFDAGTRLVWLVYPELKRIMVRRRDGSGHVLTGDAMLSGEDVLKGFEVSLAELFGE